MLTLLYANDTFSLFIISTIILIPVFCSRPDELFGFPVIETTLRPWRPKRKRRKLNTQNEKENKKPSGETKKPVETKK
jgi:hypothetical protein